jgi:hypothetical protein
MNACLRCGDAIDRDGGALLQYCAFCVRLERPYNWNAQARQNKRFVDTIVNQW